MSWSSRLALPLLTLACISAQASAPDAWKDLENQTKKDCLKKSGFKNPKVKGQSVMFEAHVLYVIEGGAAKGKKQTTYCLAPFEGKAEVSNSPVPS